MAELFLNSITGLPLPYQRAVESEAARRKQMRDGFDAYAGTAPHPLVVRGSEPDDRVRLAWPRLVVDKGATWLFGQDLPIEVTDQAAEDWLNLAWPMERRMIGLMRCAVNGGIAGHVFAKIIDTKPYPRLVVLDPLTVLPTYNPDDFEDVLRYRIEYPATDPSTGHPITFRQVHERSEDGSYWTVTDQTTDANGSVISKSEYVWPYAFSQIVEAQNIASANEYWGEPDLTPELLKLCSTIERVASQTNKMVRIYANPILWVAGMMGCSHAAGEPHGPECDDLDLTPGGVVLLPEPEQRLNVVDTKLDIEGSLNLYTRFIDDLHSFAHIPKIATDATAGQQIGRASGSAMRYHYTPLIERTEAKRRTYGAMVVEIARRMLVLGGFSADSTIRLLWPELVPDPLVDVQRAAALRDLGLSQDTTWRVAGVSDPDEEANKVAVEGGPAEAVNSTTTVSTPADGTA